VHDAGAGATKRFGGSRREDRGMSSAAKRQIIEALDDLPEQSLVTVADLVDLLRAKAVAGPLVRDPDRVPGLGGLSQGHAPGTGFAGAYAVWRSSVAADDLDVDTAYFDGLRDASLGPDVKL
jgi:hypothetical protein